MAAVVLCGPLANQCFTPQFQWPLVQVFIQSLSATFGRAAESIELKQQKSPGHRPGLSTIAQTERLVSVLRNDGAAELVVQANEAHVDVLTDAIGRRHQREGDVLVLQEDVVVLDANRPIRGKTILDAGADGAAPTGLVVRGQQRAGGRAEHLVLAAGHSRTALDVEQDVVPGVADLTGDQTERIDLGAVAGREQRADVVAGEVGPVALAFHAEHPLAGLPAVADLTTDGATGRIMRTLAGASDQIPGRMRGAAAAV